MAASGEQSRLAPLRCRKSALSPKRSLIRALGSAIRRMPARRPDLLFSCARIDCMVSGGDLRCRINRVSAELIGFDLRSGFHPVLGSAHDTVQIMLQIVAEMLFEECVLPVVR